MPITKQELKALCREGHLYHLSKAGNWPSMQKYGLLSTSAWLDLFRIHGEEREAIESQRRPERVELVHPDDNSWRVTIRDQKPLKIGMLRACLNDDCTPEEFCRLLNKRVYFWLDRRRVDDLLHSYPDVEHDLLTIDAFKFIDAYEDQIRLSHLNSGAVRHIKHRRGRNLFKSLADFPYEIRKKYGRGAVAELTVEDKVEDFHKFVVDAQPV